MSPLRRHASWQNRLFFGERGFGPSSVKRGRTHIVLGCSMPQPLHTLKIWGAGVNSARSYGAEFVVFLCLFVRHAPARSTVYGHQQDKHRSCQAQKALCICIELGGNGHKPPGQKSPRPKDPRGKSAQRRHILLQR